MAEHETRPVTGVHSVFITRAAEILGVSRRTVYNRIRAGYLRTIRVGRSQRVTVESIEFDRVRLHRGEGRAKL